VIDVGLVRMVAENQGYLSPEKAKALEEQVARTQQDLERIREADPDWQAEVDTAIEAFNRSDIDGAKAAFARIDALIAKRRAELSAQERELRLEEARSKHAQATLFYPFEASRSEPLLTQAAELAETNIWYWIACGQARIETGNLGGAGAAFVTARDLAATSGEERDRAAALAYLGDVRVAQGELPAALQAYEESLQIARDLAARDPGNAGWARDVLASLWRMAGIDTDNATKYWEEVIARMEDMAARSILLPMDAPYLEAARKNLDASRQ
jgi:tetratricopeptide (TPR) repeat protein